MSQAVLAGAKNWKTTVASILVAVSVMLVGISDFLTGEAGAAEVVKIVAESVAAVAVLAWGWLSRDADKTSEQSMLKKPRSNMPIADGD